MHPVRDRGGDVTDFYPTEGLATQVTEVRVAVNDEVWPVLIQHLAQFAVAKHPVLRQRFPAKRAYGRGEVHQRDAVVRVECSEGLIKRQRLPARAHGKPLQRARVDGVGTFDRPEPSPTPGGGGDSDANAGSGGEILGPSVNQPDACPVKRPAKRGATQRAQVVVTQHRERRNACCRQHLCLRLGLLDAAVVGPVARHEQ